MITAADIMSDADVAELAGVSVDTFQRSLRVGVCRMLLHFAAESRKAKLPEYGYPRSCSPDNCRNCQFAGFCLERIHVDAECVPQGFVIAPHQELSTPHVAADEKTKGEQ